jgi:alkylation response protein AidB-like acyl-CoA dehydrogenase
MSRLDLAFSQEQEEMRHQIRRALSDHCSYEGLRRLINADDPYDRALWRKAGELGWLGVAIPEEYGGLGLGAEELCIVAEELGRVLAPIPFASSICLAAEAIRLHGSPAQKAQYLPGLASGAMIGALAVAEGPSWDIDKPAASVRDGALTGRKLPVADGAIADLIVVTAQDASGALQLLVVETDQPGVERKRVRVIDELRHHSVVEFRAARATPLSTPNGARAALDRIYDGGAVFTAFEQLGGADVCLEMARAYSLERKTFGRVIGSYQALKHRMADMYANNELARSNAYAGAWGLAQEKPELPMLAGLARVSASEALLFAASENLQIHGGIGYTFEGNCHFYYRRARLLDVCLGATAAWSDRVVDAFIQSEGNA